MSGIDGSYRVANRQAVRPATAVGLAATLGLAAACWVLAVWQMSGMNMGVGTSLGSFVLFAALWVPMMAAMMLPGAVPAVLRRAQGTARVTSVLAFTAAYLAVWALAGIVVYVLYQPHGTAAAGALVIAAGVYELTPAKRYFRRRCHESTGSGWAYALSCVGSSAGLMVVWIALGVMSLLWMSVVAAVVIAQKFLPARAALDVPLALVIIAFGVWIVAAPSAVPWLMPSM
jgi:predicted metal-binding membrane protein